jgi:competence protein ComEC
VDANVQVQGRVTETPLPNRSGKLRFLLAANHYTAGNLSGPTSGNLYVTVPTEQGKKLLPGQTIQLTGRLYRPQAGEQGQFYQTFNFQKFLAAQNCFAGLAGRQVKLLQSDAAWGVWAIRQRIATAQAQALGDSAGPVLSSMVLGNRAVQVPFTIGDQFRRVGLSHALAASGFQISLILTTVLALTRTLPKRLQFGLGGLALVGFGVLSGFAPSVLRAVLLGLAGLVAMVGQTKIKPIPMLFVIAIVMLLLNPLWIQDLGFQFSFLATLGLMVSANPIAQRLDWLPPRIAEWLAVPIAATLWVMPLQLSQFGQFPVYGLLVNVLTAPLLTVITVAGFISSLLAIPFPALGGAVAWLLQPVLALLLGFVKFASQLPGSSVAVGAVSWFQMGVLYGLLLALWLVPWCRKQWQWGAWVGLMVVLLPVWHVQSGVTRVTVLANNRLPMLVVQQPGANLVFNSGAGNATQSLSSFLSLQGINQIDDAFASNRSGRSQAGWSALSQDLQIHRYNEIPTANSDVGYQTMLQQLPSQIKRQTWQVGQQVYLDQTQIELLRAEPLALRLQLVTKNWLLLADPKGTAGHEIWLQGRRLPPVEVLWWVGKPTSAAVMAVVNQVRPRTVILATPTVDAEVWQQLQAQGIQVFWSERDGALQWDGHKFIANLDALGEERP